MRSAVILAGGAGSRLGSEKWLLQFERKPLICWTVEKLQRVTDEVVVVGRDAHQIESLRVHLSGIRFCCDSICGWGPVAGLASGTKCARGRLAFATGCDLPFLNTAVIEKLFLLAEGYEACVPVRPNGMMEPLHAVFDRKRMLSACENALKRGERRISAPLGDLKVNRVPVELLSPLDPELLTFFNINTREDLSEARCLWALKPGPK